MKLPQNLGVTAAEENTRTADESEYQSDTVMFLKLTSRVE